MFMTFIEYLVNEKSLINQDIQFINGNNQSLPVTDCNQLGSKFW